ncbi:MAG: hypothetical protein ONB11_10910 [candidate division KSB1 bacterium]|nr:hypothetical protein [candidate division KSB1 bacterium]
MAVIAWISRIAVTAYRLIFMLDFLNCSVYISTAQSAAAPEQSKKSIKIMQEAY